MAEEQKAPEGGAEKAEEAPKKKINPVLLLLIGQCVVLSIVTGVIAKFVLFSKPVHYTQTQMKDRAIASIKDIVEEIRYVDMENFTVTLPDKYSVRVRIQLEVSNPEVEALLKERLPAIRSTILNTLSTLKGPEAKQLATKLYLKDQLRHLINEELFKLKWDGSKGIVREVYLTELFIV